ncbi:S8 family serine peptidase [Deinococcus sp. QL22]|uniref:S8 family serine peptidase n=1 Tax=Deinococcus sp. QL22 TaxID=2939437 RepID=UPI002017979C|nr:S8 family serine peptidase [Deinococcus sp. QL22]UQN08409.1 S8 family serine peptidase [Deinococcus sp. QL22]
MWAEGARLWGEGGTSVLSSNTAWLQQVKAQEAQAQAGKGVTIALLDSGVDFTHPMLRSVLLPGHDFVDADGNASEQGNETDLIYGHGTAVAGVLQQMAPAARILPLRVLGTDGSGQAAHVAQAIRLAVDEGAHIINLSVAGPVSSEGVRAALQYAASRNVLVVAASGNNGGSAPQAPADALNHKNRLGDFGLSVTAVDQSGHLPLWSTRGGEVQAPGVNIHTAYPGGRLVTASGSSFAAPVVCGALALALAQGKEAQTLAAQLSSGRLLDVEALLK